MYSGMIANGCSLQPHVTLFLLCEVSMCLPNRYVPALPGKVSLFSCYSLFRSLLLWLTSRVFYWGWEEILIIALFKEGNICSCTCTQSCFLLGTSNSYPSCLDWTQPWYLNSVSHMLSFMEPGTIREKKIS